jgi:hypothetical protein
MERMVKSNVVLTIRANADGIKTSKEGKLEKTRKFIKDWANFRSKLPTQSKQAGEGRESH